MNKFFRTVLVLGMLALSLGTLSRSLAQTTPTTIRIFVGLGSGTSDEQKIAQNVLASEWNAKHKDIQILFDYNAANTARDTLLTQIAAGTPPDIVGPAGIRSVYETSGMWADLSAYIKRDAAALKLDTDFDKASLALYEIGSQQIALPLGIYPGILFVNTDLFKAAEVPLPPTDFNKGKPMYEGKVWDMAALQKVALRLTRDAKGVYADEAKFDPAKPDVFGYADMWTSFRGWAKHFGVKDSGLATDNKTAIFNSPEWIEAMTYRHDAIFKYHTHPSDAEGQTLGNPFESGRVALWSSASWYASCCLKGAKFNWTVAVPPVASNGMLTAAGNADTFATMSGSTKKDAAWEVLKWLTSSEMSGRVCEIYGCLPARVSSRGDWEKATKKSLPQLNLDVVYGAIPYIDVPNSEAYMPNYAKANDALNTLWTQLNTDAKLDVEPWMKDANGKIQKIFDEQSAK